MESQQKTRILVLFNFITLIAMITINALANILPINGLNTGAISDSLPNLFAPAGLTFAIWGLIYLLLTIFVVVQLKVFKENGEIAEQVNKIGPYFAISSLANFVWILFWHYELFELSLLMMLVILACLMIIYLKLEIGKSNVSKNIKATIHVPISVYFGWISVATIANVTGVLVDNNWDGFGISEPIWTLIVIIVGLLLGVLMLMIRKDIPYALVVVWAYIGIYIKRIDPIWAPQPLVAYSALVSAIILSILSVFVLVKARK